MSKTQKLFSKLSRSKLSRSKLSRSKLSRSKLSRSKTLKKRGGAQYDANQPTVSLGTEFLEDQSALALTKELRVRPYEGIPMANAHNVGERDRQVEIIVEQRKRERESDPFRHFDQHMSDLNDFEQELIKEGNSERAVYLRKRIEEIKHMYEPIERMDEGHVIRYTPNNTNKLYPNFITIGSGGTKLASVRSERNGFVYLSPVEGGRKIRWEEDYDFSLLLNLLFPDFFPRVITTLVSPHLYTYKKEECKRVVKYKDVAVLSVTQMRSQTQHQQRKKSRQNRLSQKRMLGEGGGGDFVRARDYNKVSLTKKILKTIIERTIELLTNHRLFTLDLKPSNVGILKRKILFIDFGPDCSFFVKDGCDLTEYTSAIILILLVYCYSFMLSMQLTKEDLRGLAREFIPNRSVSSLFHPDYMIETDPCLDLYINRRVAPSFNHYLKPITVLSGYGGIELSEIIADLGID